MSDATALRAVRALQAENAALRQQVAHAERTILEMCEVGKQADAEIAQLKALQDATVANANLDWETVTAERDALRADLAKMQWHESIGESYRERLVKAEADLARAKAVLESADELQDVRNTLDYQVVRVDCAAWVAWRERTAKEKT